MPIRIGEVEGLYRYPVKSMMGGAVMRRGRIAVGQPVFLEPAAEDREGQ